MKKVLITGVTGQIGSTMVDYLLENTDCEIYGVVRRLSVPNHKNIKHILSERFHLVTGDITDPSSVNELVKTIQPNYIFNFAANSFVGNSWSMPIQHMKTNFMSVVYFLEAIRNYAPECRIYQSSTSEEVGNVDYSPQDENHPLKPRSPYGVSKCAARLAIKVWRESYGLYAVAGRLYNTEGERRGEEFVTRKISKGVARILSALENGEHFAPIELGNLDAKRDWSHAEDIVHVIWKTLNQELYRDDLKALSATQDLKNAKFWSDKIKDYIYSSNETHSIREFVERAFAVVGIDGIWVGSGIDEKFILPNYVSETHGVAPTLVKINPKFFRPAEVDLLWGDSSLARKELDWSPKVCFDDLVKRMVAHDVKEETEKRS